MRIAHCITGLQQAAGTTVFVIALCEQLHRLGVNSVICVQRKTQEDQQTFIPVEEGLASIERADLVHIHALWSPFLHQAVTLARKRGVPYVVSPHGMLTPWALKFKWFKKWMALNLYQRADLRGACFIHATAPSEEENIRTQKLTNPVVLLPLGVDVLPKTKLQALTLLRPKRRTVLFVSRIHPKKGLLNLVHAWSRLKAENMVQGWQVLIAGPAQDGHDREVMALAEKEGVATDIQILDPVYGKAKTRLYAQADIFVLPTFSENFGSVVIEALACGLPVITTKGAPWVELETEQCGYWIEIGVDPLMEALRKMMLLSDEERREMGKRGTQLIEKKYMWPAIGRHMYDEYAQILKDRI